MRQTSKRFDTPYEIDIVKSLSVSSRGSSCSCARASGWSRSSTRCSTFSGTRSRSRGFLTMILRQFVFACGSRWATLCTRGSVEDNSPFSGRERTSWHFTVMQDYKFSFRSTPSTLSTGQGFVCLVRRFAPSRSWRFVRSYLRSLLRLVRIACRHKTRSKI